MQKGNEKVGYQHHLNIIDRLKSSTLISRVNYRMSPPSSLNTVYQSWALFSFDGYMFVGKTQYLNIPIRSAFYLYDFYKGPTRSIRMCLLDCKYKCGHTGGHTGGTY